MLRGRIGASPPEHHHPPASVQPTKAWFCPMCPGVESDEPGACPKCGMALERNPAFTNRTAVLYTCPMHPEVRQDHPGVCPICGMALEPVQATLRGRERRTAVDGLTFQSGPGIGTAGAGSRDGRAFLQFGCYPTESLGMDSIHRWRHRWFFGAGGRSLSAECVRSSPEV